MVPTLTNRAASSIPTRAVQTVGANLCVRPSSTTGEIKRIRVEGKHLEIGDVVLDMPVNAVSEYRIVHIISRNLHTISAQCVDDKRPNAPLTIRTFGSVNRLETVIGGPKWDAALKDRSHLKWCNPNWVWQQPEKASV